MKDNYADLIDVIDGKYCFKINFFKPSKTFRDVFSVSEGTSGLSFLMNYYRKEVNAFNTCNFYMPIIIIIDNDKGANGIKQLIKLQNEASYYKLFYKQMYVVFVDKNENTKIEDLFDKELFNIEVSGKKFKADKTDEENDKYFGKHIFSQKIILPNYETINFERFRPIFDSILEIMSECKKNV